MLRFSVRGRTTFGLSCNAYLNFYDVPGYFRFHRNGVLGWDTLATHRCIIDIFYTSIVSAGYARACVCVRVCQAVTSFQRIFFLEMHQQRRRNDATVRRLILRPIRSNLRVWHAQTWFLFLVMGYGYGCSYVNSILVNEVIYKSKFQIFLFVSSAFSKNSGY